MHIQRVRPVGESSVPSSRTTHLKLIPLVSRRAGDPMIVTSSPIMNTSVVKPTRSMALCEPISTSHSSTEAVVVGHINPKPRMGIDIHTISVSTPLMVTSRDVS